MSDVFDKISFFAAAVAAAISMLSTVLAYRSKRSTESYLESKVGPLPSNVVIEEFAGKRNKSSENDAIDEDKS